MSMNDSVGTRATMSSMSRETLGVVDHPSPQETRRPSHRAISSCVQIAKGRYRGRLPD